MSGNQIRRDVPGAASAGTPEAARIRSYLQSQAETLSVPQLAEKVRRDMMQFRYALFAVPADKLTVRPTEDDWSGNEIAHHLVQTSAMVAGSIRAVLDNGEPPPRVVDRMMPTDATRTAAGWWDQLFSDREVILERVVGASGDEHLDVRWEHAVFGDLNWREWLLFMRVHDLDHARQILTVTDAIGG